MNRIAKRSATTGEVEECMVHNPSCVRNGKGEWVRPFALRCLRCSADISKENPPAFEDSLFGCMACLGRQVVKAVKAGA